MASLPWVGLEIQPLGSELFGEGWISIATSSGDANPTYSPKRNEFLSQREVAWSSVSSLWELTEANRSELFGEAVGSA